MPPTPSTDEIAELVSSADLLRPMAIRAAVTLGIPECATEWATVEEVADRTGSDLRAIRALVRYLAALRLIHVDAEQRVRLSERGQVLLRAHPAGLARHWDMASTAWHLEQVLLHLVDVCRRGESAYPKVHGDALYDVVERSPEFLADSLDSASPFAASAAARLAQWLDLKDGTVVLDVGCGTGIHLLKTLTAHPSSRGIAFDLPQTLARAEAAWPESEVTNRIEAVPGNFRVDALPSADVCLLSAVLVDLDDAAAITLLAHIRHTAAPQRLVLVELDRDEADPFLSAHLDLHQLCMTGGSVRSVEELTRLARATGWTLQRTETVGGGLTFIEFSIEDAQPGQ